ncbi:MAG: response regulator [Euryarchaeota archaeon]|nr:response regulator [Euryarchaeota archaeon]
MKILAVDDEMELLTLIKDFLETVGHSVDIAIDGQTGLKKFKKKNYDLVLMDHRMYGEEGLSVSKKMLEIDNNAKIVFISANSSIKEEALDSGAVGFLAKPFDLDDLVKKVEVYK